MTRGTEKARRLLRRAGRARSKTRAVQRRGVKRLDAVTRALRKDVPGVAEWRSAFLGLCADLEARVEELCEQMQTARDIYRGERLALLNRRKTRRLTERRVRDSAELRVRVVPEEETSVALFVSPLQAEPGRE